MQVYSLTSKPEVTHEMRKTSTIHVAWVNQAFIIRTQEEKIIIDEDTDGWDGGYYIAYPSDGSEPYAISRSFIESNYVDA